MAARSQAAVHKTAEVPVSALAQEIVAGLTAKPKQIPPKYFYDEKGAQLFEAITETPEYYPTRCEIAILRERAHEVARFIPEGAAVVEFGSGSSRKARLLIEAAPTIAAYVPVDISSQLLLREAPVGLSWQSNEAPSDSSPLVVSVIVTCCGGASISGASGSRTIEPSPRTPASSRCPSR